MKANELRPCDLCGRGLMHAGHISFYRLSIERMGIDLKALRERAGLTLLLGGSERLAEVFAPTADIATPICPEPDVLLVCEVCAVNFDHPRPVAQLAEIAEEHATAKQRAAAGASA